MLTCPICNAVVNDRNGQRQRCLSCGGVLSWENSGRSPQEVLQESQAGASAPDYQKILHTVIFDSDTGPPIEAAGPQEPRSEAPADRDAATPAPLVDNGPEEPAPPERPNADPPPSSPVRNSLLVEEDPSAHSPQGAPDFRDLFKANDDVESHLSQVWADQAQRRTPVNTIKTDSEPTPTQTNLVIRISRVSGMGEMHRDADFELLKEIGRGGVGVVYAANQRSMDRTVALKVLQSNMASDFVQQEKFLTEAVVTAELDHPNIVPIYNLSRDEQGELFYSMKRVQGTPWDQVIRSMSQEENLDVLLKVADAVGFAHARGVVHRDLKPENIMLGEFGEVLVMDWGIALPTEHFTKSGSIGGSSGMGGTPAYMAPEMAVGPIATIGPASDIYLLGAILYEILTGRPPHAGQTVMDCLKAVAKNAIEPPNASGELVDVAYRAMETNPRERFSSVKDFQSAVRQCQSHSESVVLTRRAVGELDQARQNGDYQDFARALFGFQEALELWAANDEARDGVRQTQDAYARCALAKGDVDLGLSLLEADDPGHAVLRGELEAAQKDRQTRHRMAKRARRTALISAAAIFVVVCVSLVQIYRQYKIAVAARQDAHEKAEKLAKSVSQLKSANDEIAKQYGALEEANQEVEVKRNDALSATAAAKKAQAEAESLRNQEEQIGYVAQMGLASERIAGNAFDDALSTLLSYSPPAAASKTKLRHWEWGRLMYLCRLPEQAIPDVGRVESVAISQQGRRFIAGGQQGLARVYAINAAGKADPNQAPWTLDHQGAIYATAISHDGAVAVTAGEGPIRLWRLGDTAEPFAVLSGHRDDVLSVNFSRDGGRLLSGAKDFTARLWDVETGEELRAFRGHNDPVNCAAFSHDEQRVATAGEDHVVMIWDIDSDEKPRRFFGHHGPVYCVAFSEPDEDGIQWLASAGYDKDVLIYNPDDLQPFDFRALDVLTRPEDPASHKEYNPEPRFRTLASHTAAVRWLTFIPSQRRLVTAGHDNTVKLWDLAASPDDPDFVTTMRGHGGWIRSGAVLTEPERIVTAGYDERIQIYNPAAYREQRVLQGHEDAVLDASYSPNGKFVATAGRDRVARIWPVGGGEPAVLTEGPKFLALGAAFFDDGNMLAVSSGDNTLRKWRCATGGQEPFESSTVLQGVGRRGALAVTADAEQIITGSEQNEILVWDAKSGEQLHQIAGHLAEVAVLAVSPDDQLLASGDVRGQMFLWQRQDNGGWEKTAQLVGHSPGNAITALAFLPDGKTLLSASEDNSVGHWNIPSGMERRELSLAHPDSVRKLALSPSGRWAVTVCADGFARLWNVQTGQATTIDLPNQRAQAAVFSPDESYFMVAYRGGRLRRFEFDPAAATRDLGQGELFDAKGALGEASSLLVLPYDEQVLIVGGNHARLWHLQTGRKTRSFSPNGVMASIHFSADNKFAATAGWDGIVKIWSVADSKVVRQITDAHLGRRVNSVRFSPLPGDLRVLTAGDDGAVRTWDAASGEQLRMFTAHQGPVRSAVFSPDGRRIATVGDDGIARLWKLDGADQAAPIEMKPPGGSPRPLQCVAFTGAGSPPDLQGRIITGGDDNEARIWSESGELLLTLSAHTAPVNSVAFSHDGKRVLTAGGDNIGKLWDAVFGREIFTFAKHSEALTAATFSPDGRQALTAGRDGRAVVWPTLPWTEEDMAAR